MTGPIILTEKLRRPDVIGLPRPRLEKPLLDQASRALVLVVAPPGAGKTTLLTRASASAGRPTAWYRVTADDRSEAAFTGYLARSLHDALDIPLPATDRMDDLLAALDGWTGTGLLVVDDLHEIAGTAAEATLDRLVSLRPPGLKMMIGSRRPPDLNLPRLLVSGALYQITSDDLRFRSWEVEELFVGVFGEPLAPEAAAALTRRTGGWAAGLQLFHLSTRSRSASERAQAVEDLGGRSKLIRSYLARNVLSALAPARRDFLLHTSTLGVLTGPLCDALLETSGSARVLDELEQQQLFTSSDDDGRTFRYHEVLRAHLEVALVEEYGVAGAREWHTRSGALLEAAGERRAAARSYARAEDWAAVARLVHSGQQGSTATGFAVADLLPPGVVEHDPWLALVDARRRLRNGGVSAAVDIFARASALLDEPGFRDRCDAERVGASIWLPAGGTELRPPPADYAWAAAIRSATRDINGTTTPLAPTGTAADRLASGVGALLSGNLRWAAAILSSVAADGRASQAHRLTARLAGGFAELVGGGSILGVARRGGNVPGGAGDGANVAGGGGDVAGGGGNVPVDLTEMIAEVAVEAETDGLAWLARLARGLSSAVLIAAREPSWRTASFDDLLTDCEEAGDDWGAALLQLVVGIAGVVGDDRQAAVSLTSAATRFNALQAPVPQCWAESLAALDSAARHGAGSADRARSVAERAVQQGIHGAEALALTAVALADPGNLSAARRAETAVGATGLRAAVLALVGPGPADPAPDRTDVAAAGRSSIAVTVEPPAPRAAGSTPRQPLVMICFGGLTIEIDGTVVDLAHLRPRSRTLLRILALSTGQHVHRERLMDWLWPDTEVTVATRRLQVAVSSVRHLLEQAGLAPGSGVVRHGDAYSLELPVGSVVDVRDFEQLLRRADIAPTTAQAVAIRQQALALYLGELFPEEGPAEFVVAARDRLRLAAAGLATRIAEDAAELGWGREALTAARRAVQLEPYQDRPWQLLSELHEAAGDPSAAEQARRDHARARDELEGVS